MPKQERRPGQRPNPRSNRPTSRPAPGPESVEPPADVAPSQPTGAPTTLRWAVGLLFGETLGLLVVIGFLVFDALTGPAQRGASATGVIVFAILMAVILAGLAFALHRRKAWARGPAVVLQLLLVLIGGNMINGGQPVLGVLVIAIGLGAAGTLIAPATRAALESRHS